MIEDSRLRAAHAALMSGAPEDALRIVDDVLDLAPTLEALLLRSEILEVLGRPGEAIGTLQEAVRRSGAAPVPVQSLSGMLERHPGVEPIVPALTAPPAPVHAPYPRPEHAPDAIPVPAWMPWAGWGLAVANFLCMIAYFAILAPIISRVTPGMGFAESQRMMAENPEFVGRMGPIVLLGYVVWFAAIGWIVLDTLTRRAKWGWCIAYGVTSLLCCIAPYLGPAWFLLPMYMLLGRASPRTM